MSQVTPKPNQGTLHLNHDNARQTLRKAVRSDAADQGKNAQDSDARNSDDQGSEGITEPTLRGAPMNEPGSDEDASSDNQSEFRHDANRSNSPYSEWHKENPGGNYDEWHRQKNAGDTNSGEHDAGATEK